MKVTEEEARQIRRERGRISPYKGGRPVRLGVRIREELKERLRLAAEADSDLSMSDIVELALIEYLTDTRNTANVKK